MHSFDDRAERGELSYIQNPSAPNTDKELESFISDTLKSDIDKLIALSKELIANKSKGGSHA